MTFLDAYDVWGSVLSRKRAPGCRRIDRGTTNSRRLALLYRLRSKGLNEWYVNEASQFKWGMEEYRHYYGNATFDDGNTASATRFLLRFYTTTREPRYRVHFAKHSTSSCQPSTRMAPGLKRYPLRNEFSHDGFPDYTSYYTLNDGSAKTISRCCWKRQTSSAIDVISQRQSAALSS